MPELLAQAVQLGGAVRAAGLRFAGDGFQHREFVHLAPETHLVDYFALIPRAELALTRGANAADVAWVPAAKALKGAPLAFDHGQILAAAVERLRGKVEYTSLPAFLPPEPFTLQQLQQIYEVVLGRPVDKSGLRTRMLAADFLDGAGPVAGTSHRPAMGYRLRDRSTSTVFPRTFSPRG